MPYPYSNKNNHKSNNDKSVVDRLNRLKAERMEYNVIYANRKMICNNCKIELNDKNQVHEC